MRFGLKQRDDPMNLIAFSTVAGYVSYALNLLTIFAPAVAPFMWMGSVHPQIRFSTLEDSRALTVFSNSLAMSGSQWFNTNVNETKQSTIEPHMQ